MKHVKKVALMLTTTLLIISLTSCAFLEWLWPSPQTQDDWIPESREQTDMIFANYMDYAEKTIHKYFPDKNVQYKCEMDEEGVLSYVFDLEFDLDITVKLIYWCHYEYPYKGEMTALLYMQILPLRYP